MIIYMLRNKENGKYWRRGNVWVTQEFATPWTTARGPVAARTEIKRKTNEYNRSWRVRDGGSRQQQIPETEVVKFQATEITDASAK